jgi:FkbM family methyltransferase
MKEFFQKNSPPILYGIVASIYWVFHPIKKTQVVYPVGCCWLVWNFQESYYTLKRSDNYISSRGSEKCQNFKYNRYNLQGFCEIEPNDVVVDIGAFLGEFSIAASDIANRVIAVEPDDSTYECLKKQVNDKNNITIKNVVVSSKTGVVTFKKAEKPSESSISNVDQGGYTRIKSNSYCLEDLINDLGVSKIDFLKVDAEGAEPEVVEGMDCTQIKKLAIDVGNERFGEDTVAEVTSILESKGYSVRIKKDRNDDKIAFAVPSN